MEEFVLYFGMVAVVVIDEDRRFRGTFEAMCKLLKIKFCYLAHRYHKLNSVDNYHWFLNKTQVITGQDHGSHNVLIKNVKTY